MDTTNTTTHDDDVSGGGTLHAAMETWGHHAVRDALSGEGATSAVIRGAVAMEMAGIAPPPAGGLSSNRMMLRAMRRAQGIAPPDIDLGVRQGHALPEPIRDRMERAFGHDFTHVRIHTDSRAAKAAREIHAAAFAVGADIFFGAHRWAPGTRDGQRLLAHELTHVVQHDEGRIPSDAAPVSSPHDATEREAARNEALILDRLDGMSDAPTIERTAQQAAQRTAADAPALRQDAPTPGLTEAEVDAALREMALRYAECAALFSSGASSMAQYERRHAEHRGWAGAFVAWLNEVPRPNASRWLPIAEQYARVSARLQEQSAAAVGDEIAGSLQSFEQLYRLDVAQTDAFLHYLHGAAQAAEDTAFYAELGRDIAFALLAGTAAVAAAPVVGGMVAGGALQLGASSLIANSAGAVASLGTAATVGGLTESGLQGISEVGIALTQADELSLSGVLDAIDWSAASERTWAAFCRGTLDGVFSLIGMRADQLALQGVQQIGRRLPVLPAISQRTRLILQRTLEHAIAGGASGAGIGALEEGARTAAAGGTGEEIVASMKSGFVIGGAVGGAGGGLAGLHEGWAAGAANQAVEQSPSTPDLVERGREITRMPEAEDSMLHLYYEEMDDAARERFAEKARRAGQGADVAIIGKDAATFRDRYNAVRDALSKSQAVVTDINAFTKVWIGGWTPSQNLAWMEGIIDSKAPVVLTHAMTPETMGAAADPSFFKREIDYFLERGYRWDRGYAGPGVGRLVHPQTPRVTVGRADPRDCIVGLVPSVGAIAITQPGGDDARTGD
ncbi:MAG: DUF4157 domain-containing protein [Myxococcota bacterium]